jgi:four helix bundle protein
MQDFRNLSVWQRARRLTKSVYEMTADFPGSEEFGLKSQMRRATVSIRSNIAEGCGRRGDRARRTPFSTQSFRSSECSAVY